MKLVTFLGPDGREAPGVLREDGATLVDLSPHFADMLALIDAGPAGLERAEAARRSAQATLPLAEVRLRAPVPVPRQVRDCMVFETHIVQAMGQAMRMAGLTPPADLRPAQIWYDQPVYYKSNRFSVIGPDQDIVWPRYSSYLDFELELGLIVGRKGVDLDPATALDHVFGYLIFNDVSARDAQFAEMEGRLGPAKGKDFDTGNVMGPWLVTADEVGDPHDLRMVARLNGEVVTEGHSSAMHHRFDRILSHITQSETIHPGEFIGSGTVGGGCLLEHGRRLAPGDVIELEIEKLGILRNRVVRPQKETSR
jgi:2-keto-4-pentenoate hydratase/2-oxohepta-3-ene-1,7-dioic acid hydratase in catechol pathway